MIEKKIISLADFLKKKSQLGQMVFTNGCFDILHNGHVTYLEAAASLGDTLIVGVNTDRSVRKLKGPGRPVNGVVDRMRVLAALESVAYVISFDQETPIELIEAIQPQVLVKGGDYKTETIVGAKETIARGGEVRTIALVPGRSTTRAIAKIKRLSTKVGRKPPPTSKRRRRPAKRRT
jgi:rfaE bifunctional protein nucleotidyltransferase chain/domain